MDSVSTNPVEVRFITATRSIATSEILEKKTEPPTRIVHFKHYGVNQEDKHVLRRGTSNQAAHWRTSDQAEPLGALDGIRMSTSPDAGGPFCPAFGRPRRRIIKVEPRRRPHAIVGLTTPTQITRLRRLFRLGQPQQQSIASISSDPRTRSGDGLCDGADAWSRIRRGDDRLGLGTRRCTALPSCLRHHPRLRRLAHRRSPYTDWPAYDSWPRLRRRHGIPSDKVTPMRSARHRHLIPPPVRVSAS